MKSVGILTAAVAALLFAGCRNTPAEQDGMMAGKKNGETSAKKDSCCAGEAGAKSEATAAKKDDCCAGEAKTDASAKKDGCPMTGAKTEATTDAKFGCCAEGKSEAKIASGCCKGKAVSVACADCKKACEAAGGCDTGKKCDEKACDEKPKP